MRRRFDEERRRLFTGEGGGVLALFVKFDK